MMTNGVLRERCSYVKNSVRRGLYTGRMAGETRSFAVGKRVTVTASDDLTEQVAAVVSRVLGGKGTDRGARSTDRLSADRIVEVAVGQMREHGYDAVTMRSIARE